MNKDKRDMILGVVIALLYCLGLPVLFFINKNVSIALLIIIPAIWIIAVLVSSRGGKQTKENKISKEESLKKYGPELSMNIDEFNIVNDKSHFIDFVKIVSNNKITNYDFIEDNMNLDDLALKLYDCEDYYMLYFDWKEPLDTIVHFTNELLGKLNYNVKITEEQIISKDNEFIKNRRNDGIITTDNDLNVINEILKSQNYEYITFPIEADGYWLAIIPINKIEDIKVLGEYSE